MTTKTVKTTEGTEVVVETTSSFLRLVFPNRIYDFDINTFAHAIGYVPKYKLEDANEAIERTDRLNEALRNDARRSEEDLLESKAVIERVKTYLEYVREQAGDECRSEEQRATFEDVAEDLFRALEGPKFELPTELPAKIEATHRFDGYTTTLRLLSDGLTKFWQAESNGETYWPEGVLDIFHDHKILESGK
jgi:hypothetical protein